MPVEPNGTEPIHRPPSQSQPRSRKVRLRGFSPDQKEQVAKWIESKYAHLPETIARLELYLREHPDDRGAAEQLRSWRGAQSAVRQLAHFARTELS